MATPGDMRALTQRCPGLALALVLILAPRPADAAPPTDADASTADDAAPLDEGESGGGDWFPFASMRVDLGPIFPVDHRAAPSFSMFVDAGVAMVMVPDDFESNLVLRPSLGYRFDTSVNKPHYGELGLELAGSVLGSKLYLGYRPSLVVGSQTVLVDGREALLGLRHGPVIGTLLGLVTLSVSHQYIALPRPAHDLRVGLTIELDLYMWFLVLYAASM